MRHEVRLPEGDGVSEAFVGEWLVRPGAVVDVGDDLVEVMTDKANVVIAAEVAGELREICFAEEARVEAGQVLAVIEAVESSA